MTDYASQDVTSNAGSTVTERSGTASSDTVTAGSFVLWRNTGAGTHVITLTTNNTDDGLAVADRTISIAAGGVKAGPVLEEWGDANGKVAVAIDGTPSEVKYYVMGGV
jgi:hypothetical protein